MNIALAIAIARELVALAPQGISLFQQVKASLSASDEPEAKEALAALEATFEASGESADKAIEDALGALPKTE